MKKKVYIHIGNFKTGTSAIQLSAVKNSEKMDFYYPNLCRTNRNVKKTNHCELSIELMRKFNGNSPYWYEPSGKSLEDYCELLIDEINSQEKNKVLISSEEFFRACSCEHPNEAVNKLKEIFSSYDVKILMYIREPLSLIQSWYNQENKAPAGIDDLLSFFNLTDENIFSQYGVYSLYSHVFGEENVIVRQYNKKGSEHLNEFFNILGESYSIVSDEFNNVNTRIKDNDLESIRINKRLHMLIEPYPQQYSFTDIKNKINRINNNYKLFDGKCDGYIESKLTFENITLNARKNLNSVYPQKDLRSESLKLKYYKLGIKDILMQYLKISKYVAKNLLNKNQ